MPTLDECKAQKAQLEGDISKLTTKKTAIEGALKAISTSHETFSIIKSNYNHEATRWNGEHEKIIQELEGVNCGGLVGVRNNLVTKTESILSEGASMINSINLEVSYKNVALKTVTESIKQLENAGE